jgi:endo-1,4-beta-xylanase
MKNINRINIGVGLYLKAFLLTISLAVPVAQAAGGLRDFAATDNLRFGCAVDVRPLTLEADYQSAVARECGAVTPTNALKFDTVHPDVNVYDFSGADTVVAFAHRYAQDIRGHVLVWHQALPSWVTKSVKTRDQAIAVLHDHITTVMGRYRGQFYAWDVVNEAIADQGGGLRPSFWLSMIGPEYIPLAFQWAHEADPSVHLCYNDYGGEVMNTEKANAIYALLQDLRAKGVPVDCAGLEMHLSQEDSLNAVGISENMKRLAALGLEVHITELDVRIQKPFTDQKRQAQAVIYQQVLSACLGQPACTTFNLWGITDKYSWVSQVFKTWGEALILDRYYIPKPAYYSLQSGLQ